MQKQIAVSSYLKRLKAGHGPYVSCQQHKFIPIEPPLREIKPIALTRTNILNNSVPKQMLAVKGYKCFSRLSACGEFTNDKLRSIKKSKSIKLIKRFEFDSYFTKSSNIELLTRVFHKLRLANSPNLVFRRLEILNESNLIAPFLKRVYRLKKLRVEFPSTKDFDSQGLKVLSQSMTKCVLLTYFEANFLTVPLLTPKGFESLFRYIRRFQHLKEIYMNKKCLSVKNPPQEDNTTFFLKFPKMPTLKTLYMTKAIKSGWVDMTANENEYLPFYLESILNAKNLVNFGMLFERYGVSVDVLLALAKVLPQLQDLKTVALEFLGCKLGELEMMIILDVLVRCKQIRQFTLKIIQNPNFAEDQIIEFTNCIASMDNIEKFDLYLRGTSNLRNQSLANHFSQMDNVGYALTKKSVHLYRTQSEELEY